MTFHMRYRRPNILVLADPETEAHGAKITWPRRSQASADTLGFRWESCCLSDEKKPVYTAADLSEGTDQERLSGQLPGEYPYTRGIQPTMYRGRLWTMRQ